jgi:hypothetical protein
MIAAYHRAILERALDKRVSPRALKQMVSANLAQDAWYYQFVHPHFHFDNNAFITGNAYISSQRGAAIEALRKSDPFSAWKAFGRLSHAAQDFYAHSNYVALWLARYGEIGPIPEKIEALDSALLSSPELRSGHFYLPVELLYIFPALRSYLRSKLPQDSHARMNIDDPLRPNFDYAFTAAIKRTRIEYEYIAEMLDANTLAIFKDKKNS